MFIDLTPEQHALRLKCRDYFQTLMTPDLKARMRGAEGAVTTFAPRHPSLAQIFKEVIQ